MRPRQLVGLVARLREGGHLSTEKDCQAALNALSGRRGNNLWEEALQVIGSMKRRNGPQPNPRHYATAIQACRQGGQWAQALALHEDLLDVGIARNEFTYCALLGACDEGGRWDVAVHLLGEMRRDELPPNLRACTAAISACANAGEWLHSLELLGAAHDSHLTPDVVAFTAAMNACEKGQLLDLAQELLLDMWKEKIDPNIYTYNSIIRACGPAKSWMKALQFLWLAKEEGLDPDTTTHNAVISALGQCGRWELALCAWEDMQKEELRPNVNTYLSLIGVCDQRSQWGFALKLLDKALRVGLDSGVLADIESKGMEPPRAAYLGALYHSKKIARWQFGLDALHRVRANAAPFSSLGYELATDVERNCVSIAGVKKIRKVVQDITTMQEKAIEWQMSR